MHNADPHVRFDERDVETEHGWATEAPPNERGGKQTDPTHPTVPRLDSTGLASSAFAGSYSFNSRLANARSDAAASRQFGGIVATIDGQADRERAISA